jgi:hypothetical protein
MGLMAKQNLSYEDRDRELNRGVGEGRRPF